MFLKAGALSLALLLASRLLGVVRESAQAAAFGTSGLADLALLMFTLPDWVAGVAASGALTYLLLPAWAGQPPAAVAQLQRRVARALLGLGVLLAVGLVLGHRPALDALAGGLTEPLRAAAVQGLAWAALAFPAALLAALWSTRLHHERDFLGMYGANLVVNLCLIATIAIVGWRAGQGALEWLVGGLGLGLLGAMALRLAWLGHRAPRPQPAFPGQPLPLPPSSAWAWAALSAGLPLALPFVARSAASQGGEGALATFGYAWKLVELPQVLAIQLVASLAFPAVAAALRTTAAPAEADAAIRRALALSWCLACAAAAALLVGAPALAQMVFGWGRMDATSLAVVADWGRAGAWGLLPQALVAVALTVLAAQQRLRAAAVAYGLALLALLGAAAAGLSQGRLLMAAVNSAFAFVAFACLLALGPRRWQWLPGAALLAPLPVLAASAFWPGLGHGLAGATGLAAAAAAALAVMLCGVAASADVRQALRR